MARPLFRLGAPLFLTSPVPCGAAELWICVAGADHRLRVLHSNLQTETVLQLTGHQDRINAVAYDSTGEWIASASDDRTVRLWSAESGAQVSAIQLHSPGVALCWHPADPFEVRVCAQMCCLASYGANTPDCRTAAVNNPPRPAPLRVAALLACFGSA